jgi:hypothetical protein
MPIFFIPFLWNFLNSIILVDVQLGLILLIINNFKLTLLTKYFIFWLFLIKINKNWTKKIIPLWDLSLK